MCKYLYIFIVLIFITFTLFYAFFYFREGGKMSEQSMKVGILVLGICKLKRSNIYSKIYTVLGVKSIQERNI